MGRRYFLGFDRADIAQAARNFWSGRYASVDAARGVSAREMFLSQAKTGRCSSRGPLSGMRLVFRIFDRFALRELRDPARGGEGVYISRRMREWGADVSTIVGPLRPEQEMPN